MTTTSSVLAGPVATTVVNGYTTYHYDTWTLTISVAPFDPDGDGCLINAGAAADILDTRRLLPDPDIPMALPTALAALYGAAHNKNHYLCPTTPTRKQTLVNRCTDYTVTYSGSNFHFDISYDILVVEYAQDISLGLSYAGASLTPIAVLAALDEDAATTLETWLGRRPTHIDWQSGRFWTNPPASQTRFELIRAVVSDPRDLIVNNLRRQTGAIDQRFISGENLSAPTNYWFRDAAGATTPEANVRWHWPYRIGTYRYSPLLHDILPWRAAHGSIYYRSYGTPAPATLPIKASCRYLDALGNWLSTDSTTTGQVMTKDASYTLYGDEFAEYVLHPTDFTFATPNDARWLVDYQAVVDGPPGSLIHRADAEYLEYGWPRIPPQLGGDLVFGLLAIP